MMIRRKKGFTLVEMLVVIAIIAILAAALFPAIQTAIDSARTTAMKNKGRGVWLAIVSANMEREPLERAALWPVEAIVEFPAIDTAPKYFNKLMADGAATINPEDQLVSDLKPEMLTGSGYPAPTTLEVTTSNLAWRVMKISDGTPGASAFMVSKDVATTSSDVDDTTDVTLDVDGPFKGRRVLWVTRGGGLFDAKRKYAKKWDEMLKATNKVSMLPD